MRNKFSFPYVEEGNQEEYYFLPMQVPAELKKKYLERRVEDIQILMNSLEKNDYEPALKLGHQVKGNALTFEFPHIAPLGIEIENAAKNRDKDGLKELVKRMAYEIETLRSTFH